MALKVLCLGIFALVFTRIPTLTALDQFEACPAGQIDCPGFPSELHLKLLNGLSDNYSGSVIYLLNCCADPNVSDEIRMKFELDGVKCDITFKVVGGEPQKEGRTAVCDGGITLTGI